jgi:hypothetical protein
MAAANQSKRRTASAVARLRGLAALAGVGLLAAAAG